VILVSKGIKVKPVSQESLEQWTTWTWLVLKAKREIKEKKVTLVSNCVINPRILLGSNALSSVVS